MIDDKTRFVSVLSFNLDSGDVAATSREVRQAVEREASGKKGFVGSVVMASGESSRLLVVSLWESGQAWSAAQYDQEIGRAVTDAVESAKSYDVATYETVTVVRAS